jgi:hypothetical protein
MAMPSDKRPPIGIDDDIELLTEQMAALRELGRKEDVDGETIYDFSIRWGTALAGRLRRLVYYSSSGMLTDADERRFQSLCDEMRALSELIDRFNLARPMFTDAQSPVKRTANPLRRLFRRSPGIPSAPA